MVFVEKSFPRGGSSCSAPKISKTKTNIIFGATQKILKKKKNKERVYESTNDTNEQLNLNSAELLNYETIQDGMNIMGIIRGVNQLYISVSLPGRMIARISALEISNAYTKITQEYLKNPNEQSEHYKPLMDLYSVGQIVYARVLDVKKDANERFAINMSLKPSEVHTDLQHSNIKKGFIFNGAIEEIQEHGYIIESGVRGLRTFLPIEKSNSHYSIGELIYLKVEKITHDQSTSTCICKAMKVNNIKIKNQTEPNLDYLLPASIVQFNVCKQLKNGLRGTVMNQNFTAYINEHQLSEPLALPEDYELNSNLNARILYIMPLTKLVYLTLNLRTENSENISDTPSKLKPGDIVENARVHHLGTGGVVLVLNNIYKGILSYKTITANYKGNYDQDELLSKYAKKTKHKVRILSYDIMDTLYICTDDAKIVEEKVFCIEDLQPGEFVNATVKQSDDKINGYKLQVGKIKGIIEKIFLAPSTKHLKAESKIRCRVIAVNTEHKIVYVTNRPEYMAKNCKLLTSLSNAKVNTNFVGTVVQCEPNYILVKFFNNLKGILYKQNMNGIMPTETESFYVGQTMQFRIINKNKDRIGLTLPDDVFSLGEICPIEVVNTLESGLEIKICNADDDHKKYEEALVEIEEFKGLIPLRLLSDFTDLLLAKHRVYRHSAQTEAVCIAKNIFSLRDVNYFRRNVTKHWNDIQAGDILRAYVKNVNYDVIDLWVPIKNYNKLVKVHIQMLQANNLLGTHIELTPEQVIYVKILSKEQATTTITVSAKLTDVWKGDLNDSSMFLKDYFIEIDDIQRRLKAQNASIAKYDIGDKIMCEFKGIHTESNDWIFEVANTKVVAVIKSNFVKKVKIPQIGEKQECIVLFIDYSNDLVLVSNKAFDITHIKKSKILPKNLSGKTGINAKVLLKLDNVVICSLKKGNNPLVFCPVRLHYNDFVNSCSIPLNEGDFCKLSFIHDSLPIAVPDTIWKLWKNIKRKAEDDAKAEQSKKIKLEKSNTDKIIPHNKQNKIKESIKNNDKVINNQINNNLKSVYNKEKCEESLCSKPIKTENDVSELFFVDNSPNQMAVENFMKNVKPAVYKTLSGVSNFWQTDLSTTGIQSEESSDDDENSSETGTKKKRLSAAEKFKQQRDEEARLCAIEDKLADPNHIPETADQFDRLMLSDPNNSKNWIQYMVFFLQSAEIEKARLIARRALKTISFRESQELLNIWIALINLELRYGSKECYENTLKEAITCNDPKKVYLHNIEILIDVKKTQELIDAIGVVTKKFKTEPDVWRVAANAYFNIGMPERAQQLLHHAIKSLPEREHVNTIVAFANLNQKHGYSDLAQTLLDEIVTSYPKRVDIWAQYVDLLVKSQLIDSARAVLERAVNQKLPFKKMRTIFKKYLEFEERYGDEQNVHRVKLLASEFVKNNTTL